MWDESNCSFVVISGEDFNFLLLSKPSNMYFCRQRKKENWRVMMDMPHLHNLKSMRTMCKYVI